MKRKFDPVPDRICGLLGLRNSHKFLHGESNDRRTATATGALALKQGDFGTLGPLSSFFVGAAVGIVVAAIAVLIYYLATRNS